MSSHSIPGRTTSSMYSPLPRMNRGSSLRLTEWPMPPTSNVVWGLCGLIVPSAVIGVPLARRGVDGRGGDGRRIVGGAQRSGRFLDRLHDVHVTGATAEVAGDAL